MVKNNQRPDRAGNRKRGNAPELSPEEERSKLAKKLKLTIRQQNFIDELLRDKTISATEAYIRIYGNSNRNSARALASETLAKPNVQVYKDEVFTKAKLRVAQLVDSRNERIALDASKDILDRVAGKAVTKQEITQKTVSVKLDLQGLKIGAHYIRPEDKPA